MPSGGVRDHLGLTCADAGRPWRPWTSSAVRLFALFVVAAAFSVSPVISGGVDERMLSHRVGESSSACAFGVGLWCSILSSPRLEPIDDSKMESVLQPARRRRSVCVASAAFARMSEWLELLVSRETSALCAVVLCAVRCVLCPVGCVSPEPNRRLHGSARLGSARLGSARLGGVRCPRWRSSFHVEHFAFGAASAIILNSSNVSRETITVLPNICS